MAKTGYLDYEGLEKILESINKMKTGVKLNGSADISSSVSIYAPTSLGSSGTYLTSTGSGLAWAQIDSSGSSSVDASKAIKSIQGATLQSNAWTVNYIDGTTGTMSVGSPIAPLVYAEPSLDLVELNSTTPTSVVSCVISGNWEEQEGQGSSVSIIKDMNFAALDGGITIAFDDPKDDTTDNAYVTFKLNAATADNLGGVKVYNARSNKVTASSSDTDFVTYCGVELDSENNAFVAVPNRSGFYPVTVSSAYTSITLNSGYLGAFVNLTDAPEYSSSTGATALPISCSLTKDAPFYIKLVNESNYSKAVSISPTDFGATYSVIGNDAMTTTATVIEIEAHHGAQLTLTLVDSYLFVETPAGISDADITSAVSSKLS